MNNPNANNPVSEEFRRGFANAIREARKINRDFAMKIIDQAKTAGTYPIKQQNESEMNKKELSEDLSLDELLLEMIQDPAVIIEISSNFNPTLGEGNPGIFTYTWDINSKGKRIPRKIGTKYDARCTSVAHGGDRKYMYCKSIRNG